MRFENCNNCGKWRYIENDVEGFCSTCNEDLDKGVLEVEVDQIETQDPHKIKVLGEYIEDSDKFELSDDGDFFVALRRDSIKVYPNVVRKYNNGGVNSLKYDRFRSFEGIVEEVFTNAYNNF